MAVKLKWMKMEDNKWCWKCSKFRPFTEFDKCSRNPDGCQSMCRDCSKEYYKLNKSQIREKQKLWEQAHKESFHRSRRKYKKAHPERIREQSKKYYETHLTQIKEYRNNHKEERQKYHKKYRQAHQDQFKKYERKYHFVQQIKERIEFLRQIRNGEETKTNNRSDFPYYVPDCNVGYTLGAIIGDGNFYQNSIRGTNVIRLRVTSREFADEFREQLSEITKKDLKVVPYKQIIKGKEIQVYRVCCWSKPWIKYFRCLIRHLEQFLTKARSDILKSFVRGYVDAEGCVTGGNRGSYGICIGSTEKLHIKCAKIVLERLRFRVNGIYEYRTRRNRPLFIIVISGIYFVHRYAKEIGFINSSKQLKALSFEYKTDWLRKRSMRKFSIGA